MGTRVAILCTDGQSVSVETYKHFDGCDAPQIIARANAMSPVRQIGPDQASALVAACAVTFEIDQARQIDAEFGSKFQPARQLAPCIHCVGTSDEMRTAILAAFSASCAVAKTEALSSIRELARKRRLEAGFVIVDVRRVKWCWQAFAGELEEHELSGFSNEAST